jgi:hypothetical protein
MSQVKLSVVAAAVAESCGTVVAAAVNAENSARDKWVKAGKALFKAGARVEALTKGTKEEPNPAQDDSLIEAIERMIVDALTACVKPMKFGQETYTVGALLSLTREELRDADDKVLSQTRRYWQQQVGSLFGLVRRYVDRVQNPDKERGAKKAKKKEEKTESADPIVTLQGWMANAAKMVDATDVQRFQDSAAEMIACLRRVRKA